MVKSEGWGNGDMNTHKLWKALEYLGHSDSGEDDVPSLYRNPWKGMLSTETWASEQEALACEENDSSNSWRRAGSGKVNRVSLRLEKETEPGFWDLFTHFSDQEDTARMTLTLSPLTCGGGDLDTSELCTHYRASQSHSKFKWVCIFFFQDWDYSPISKLEGIKMLTLT